MGDQNGQVAAGVLSPELKRILDQVVVQNKVLAENTTSEGCTAQGGGQGISLAAQGTTIQENNFSFDGEFV